ncbi:MAG TPA: condensation domain-containing protein [Pyrinomonadaceae bacterium]|nr:condensation domain-containing protein [Pyrinomonadaceae bacterium]
MSKAETAVRRAGLSPAQLALLQKRLATPGKVQEKVPGIPKRPAMDDIPLSYAMERVYRISIAEGRPSYYNLIMRFKGLLDVAALEKAFNELVRRHENLRSIFTTVDGRPVQRLVESPRIELPLIDLSDLPAETRETRVQQLAAEQVAQPFDLAHWPLFRLALLQLDEAEHVLLVVIAHMVCDLWSLDIVTREVTVLYDAFSQGRPSPLPEPSIQCSDFACWQRDWLQGEQLDKRRSFWTKQLEGRQPLVQLPLTAPRPEKQTFRGNAESLAMPKELSDKLETIARANGVTMYMTLLAAFMTLIYRYTQQEDVIVGSATAGRDHVDTEGVIGNFANLMPMRAKLHGNPRFVDLLQQVREVTLGAYAHQDMPFLKLIEELEPNGDPAYAPIVQICFTFNKTSIKSTKLMGLNIESQMIYIGRSAVDVTLTMIEAPHTLYTTLEYNTDLFDEAFVKGVLRDLQTILESIAAAPETRLLELQWKHN